MKEKVSCLFGRDDQYTEGKPLLDLLTVPSHFKRFSFSANENENVISLDLRLATDPLKQIASTAAVLRTPHQYDPVE